MQGWRVTMEDDHAAVLDLQVENADSKFKAASGELRLSFFGVYDGHGGDKVAHFVGKHVHRIVARQEAFKQGNIEQALKDGFLATDKAILSGEWRSPGEISVPQDEACMTLKGCADPEHENEPSGCTASVGIISNSQIFVVGTLACRCLEGHLPLTCTGECWRLEIGPRRQGTCQTPVV